MARPFVVLAHTGYGPEHWDLMLRRGWSLATWQLAQSPLGLEPGQKLPAKKLANHRLAYLTYEGPVSRGRGQVARHDEGAYELLSRGAEGWCVRLAGKCMRGVYSLTFVPGEDWVLVCEAAD
jgi:hypothetical protein